MKKVILVLVAFLLFVIVSCTANEIEKKDPNQYEINPDNVKPPTHG